MATLWLIGRFDSRDAAPLAAEVRSAFPDAAVFQFDSPAEAMASATTPADLVIVVQHRPREFSQREIDELIGTQPLARFVAALGPWCASHGRSERAWPEATTVPLWDAAARLRREAAVLAGSRTGLPLTASRDEAILFDLDPTVSNGPPASVDFDIADRALRDLLIDLVGRPALAPSPSDGGAGSVLAWDADPLGDDRLRQLSAIRASRPSIRLVALTALPTASDIARLRQAGADAVLPKPFRLGEFRAAAVRQRFQGNHERHEPHERI